MAALREIFDFIKLFPRSIIIRLKCDDLAIYLLAHLIAAARLVEEAASGQHVSGEAMRLRNVEIKIHIIRRLPV